MKKRAEVIFGLFLIVTALLYVLYCRCADAQIIKEPQVYVVPDFSGGINLSTDSTGLHPDEALTMDNLVLDMPNVASARQGYSAWNDTIFANTEIDKILIYSPSPTIRRMIVATDSNIYINSDLNNPTTENWSGKRLNFTGTGLHVTFGSTTVYQTSNQWWYLKIRDGCRLKVTGDTSATEYSIGIRGLMDDSLTITPAYKGASNASANYTIYYHGYTDPNIVQAGTRLYICDPQSYMGTFVYNDTNYWNIALIDSGIVSDTNSTNDTNQVYGIGLVHIDFNEANAYGNSNFVMVSDIRVGDYLTIKGKGLRGRRHPLVEYDFIWTAKIVSKDSTNNKLGLDASFPHNADSWWMNFSIRREFPTCSLLAKKVIRDNGKNWDDFIFGDNFLTTFYAVSGDSGFAYPKEIYCNSDSYFTLGSSMKPTDNYYIFSSIPVPSAVNFTPRYIPVFNDVMMHEGILYGSGWDYSPSAVYNRNRIWYSDISYPSYLRYNYNFDLDQDEIPTAKFVLRGTKYFATNKAIWAAPGIPSMESGGGDQSLSKVVSNIGIPDLDNFAKATEEYGYFATAEGVYRFNGIRAERISAKVDPLVRKYSGSRCVLVYQRERLYVSYADSNITLLYNEPLGAWTTLGFGMTCAYAPPDTNIIYMGIHGLPGRIYYYPNGEYADHTGATTIAPVVTYESGWQAIGGYWIRKNIEQGVFPMLTPGTANISLYSDRVDSLACDSASTDSSGNYVYHKDFYGCDGEYFKVKLSTISGDNVIFRGYRLLWNEVDLGPK